MVHVPRQQVHTWMVSSTLYRTLQHQPITSSDLFTCFTALLASLFCYLHKIWIHFKEKMFGLLQFSYKLIHHMHVNLYCIEMSIIWTVTCQSMSYNYFSGCIYRSLSLIILVLGRVELIVNWCSNLKPTHKHVEGVGAPPLFPH